jgi:hypothetical protein
MRTARSAQALASGRRTPEPDGPDLTRRPQPPDPVVPFVCLISSAERSRDRVSRLPGPDAHAHARSPLDPRDPWWPPARRAGQPSPRIARAGPPRAQRPPPNVPPRATCSRGSHPSQASSPFRRSYPRSGQQLATRSPQRPILDLRAHVPEPPCCGRSDHCVGRAAGALDEQPVRWTVVL